MPIASDPDKTTLYWLEVDKDKPLETRPVFVVRYLTRRQVDRIQDLWTQAYATDDPTKQFSLTIDILRVGIVGWRNMPDAQTGEHIPFDLENIQRALVDTEIIELAERYPLVTLMRPDDEKKSGSPAAAAGEASATSAATESV